MKMPVSNLSPAEVTRYARQITMEDWGREAQERVKSSRVLIAGAGGLGVRRRPLSPGRRGGRPSPWWTESRVSLTDLSHQILFRELDLGNAKATVAERRLKELNPFALVDSQVKNLSENNVSRLTSGHHLLLDATNNRAARFLLNQAAVKHRTPLVYAWVWEMNGCLATSWPGQGPCLACASPEGPGSGQPALLGPLAGVLGSLMALEALRILGGLGPALLTRRLTFKGKEFQFTERLLHPDPRCPVCRGLAPGGNLQIVS